MPIPSRDSRIDEYIQALPTWQQAICTHIRELIHLAEPEIEETIKRTIRPYFVLQGNICALLATKDHVNIFIYDPIAPDPHHLINQGKDNTTARSIQIYKGQKINDQAFIMLITDIAKNNRAGGWRKLR
jgi:hypothetical protein